MPLFSSRAIGRPGCNLVVALLGLAVWNCAARASCLELSSPGIRALQRLSVRDPQRALQTIKEDLDKAADAIPVDDARMAALYAVQAQSYSLLELDAGARTAALKGLQLAP